ncbi:hypothetical protein HanPSC8_Chr08g0314461 [Helianthus annuus]|nr:hypothetical protein HanPSC8_Chr08g0314461 [Helianthus annuus]
MSATTRTTLSFFIPNHISAPMSVIFHACSCPFIVAIPTTFLASMMLNIFVFLKSRSPSRNALGSRPRTGPTVVMRPGSTCCSIFFTSSFMCVLAW